MFGNQLLIFEIKHNIYKQIVTGSFSYVQDFVRDVTVYFPVPKWNLLVVIFIIYVDLLNSVNTKI